MNQSETSQYEEVHQYEEVNGQPPVTPITYNQLVRTPSVPPGEYGKLGQSQTGRSKAYSELHRAQGGVNLLPVPLQPASTGLDPHIAIENPTYNSSTNNRSPEQIPHPHIGNPVHKVDKPLPDDIPLASKKKLLEESSYLTRLNKYGCRENKASLTHAIVSVSFNPSLFPKYINASVSHKSVFKNITKSTFNKVVKSLGNSTNIQKAQNIIRFYSADTNKLVYVCLLNYSNASGLKPIDDKPTILDVAKIPHGDDDFNGDIVQIFMHDWAKSFGITELKISGVSIPILSDFNAKQRKCALDPNAQEPSIKEQGYQSESYFDSLKRTKITKFASQVRESLTIKASYINIDALFDAKILKALKPYGSSLGIRSTAKPLKESKLFNICVSRKDSRLDPNDPGIGYIFNMIVKRIKEEAQTLGQTLRQQNAAAQVKKAEKKAAKKAAKKEKKAANKEKKAANKAKKEAASVVVNLAGSDLGSDLGTDFTGGQRKVVKNLDIQKRLYQDPVYATIDDPSTDITPSKKVNTLIEDLVNTPTNADMAIDYLAKNCWDRFQIVQIGENSFQNLKDIFVGKNNVLFQEFSNLVKLSEFAPNDEAMGNISDIYRDIQQLWGTYINQKLKAVDANTSVIIVDNYPALKKKYQERYTNLLSLTFKREKGKGYKKEKEMEPSVVTTYDDADFDTRGFFARLLGWNKQGAKKPPSVQNPTFNTRPPVPPDKKAQLDNQIAQNNGVHETSFGGGGKAKSKPKTRRRKSKGKNKQKSKRHYLKTLKRRR